MKHITEEKWKCDWRHCAFGMGLAGMEACYVKGSDPMNENCPEFITEQDYQELLDDIEERQ